MTPPWVSLGRGHKWLINLNFTGKWGKSRSEGESGSGSRGETGRATLRAVHPLTEDKGKCVHDPRDAISPCLLTICWNKE